MVVNANTLNQLLDALEELLIENTAYRSSVKVLEQFLPPQVQGKVAQVVETAKADPKIREHVRSRFASLRSQFQTEGNLEKVIEELLKAVPTKKVH